MSGWNLPPGVTNDDIERQAGTDGVLSDACEEFLSTQECFSQAAGKNTADVFTVDGDPLFTVTRAIDVYDLRTLYFHSRREYDRGVKAGKETMQEQFRRLIGAAAEPVEL